LGRSLARCREGDACGVRKEGVDDVAGLLGAVAVKNENWPSVLEDRHGGIGSGGLITQSQPGLDALLGQPDPAD
jgi:hypothetical protein